MFFPPLHWRVLKPSIRSMTIFTRTEINHIYLIINTKVALSIKEISIIQWGVFPVKEEMKFFPLLINVDLQYQSVKVEQQVQCQFLHFDPKEMLGE